MKALSIINPWAHLIMYHSKNIENRTWKTDYRGRILIHVSKKMMPDYHEIIFHLLDIGLLNKQRDRPIKGHELKEECGMIIGSVDLVECVQNHNSPWAESGMWHWVLKDPVLLNDPIPSRGSLGLWEYAGEPV